MSNLEAQLNEANQYIELLEQDKKTAMEKATGLEQQLAAEKEEHEEEGRTVAAVKKREEKADLI